MIEALHRLIRPLTMRLSLALRVAILTTLAVALTLSAVSAVVFVTVRAEFEKSLDDSLLKRANDAVEAGYLPSNQPLTPEALAIAGIRVLTVQGGKVFTGLREDASFPYNHHEIEVSIGQEQSSKRSVYLDGSLFRVVAVQAGPGNALVLAQPMDSIQHALERLKLILLLTSAVGVALAGVAGWAVASNGLRPVRRLTEATERVARDSDLTPIEVTGSDELARLTVSFNSMLVALDASQERQRQLVADAGHELRTPLTSLRTNIELLGQDAESTERSLTVPQRTEIMDDVRAQLEELTTLIGDLVELARDEPIHRDPEPLDLGDVVTQALERVRLRAGDVTFDVRLNPWLVFGEPALIERAVTNLLDNAVKWSPADAVVTVALDGGQLRVEDQGPGIDPEDLPHIFDRFYRSSEARTLPGSGLGLSIVKRAAERHGGTVTADSQLGSGTTFRFELPGFEPDRNSSDSHTPLSDISQR